MAVEYVSARFSSIVDLLPAHRLFLALSVACEFVDLPQTPLCGLWDIYVGVLLNLLTSCLDVILMCSLMILSS